MYARGALMAGLQIKPALPLLAAMVLAGCATKPAPPPAAAAARAPAGAIAGQAPLGAGTGATGILDENYLYDQHQKAQQQTAKTASGSAGKAPLPPWSSGP
ncbi:hypothetical protein ACW73L_04370 [Methylolobus aquaticus]